MENSFFDGEIKTIDDKLFYIKNNKKKYEIVYLDGFFKIKNLTNNNIWENKASTAEEAIILLKRKLEQVNKSWDKKHKDGLYKVWNKGLDKNNPKIKKAIDKGTQRRKEMYKSREIKIWNKGLTKKTDKRVKKMSESRRGDLNPMHSNSTFWSDKERVEKYKQKLSEAHKGRNLGLSYKEIYGEKKAIILKEKLSNSAKKREIHGHTGHKHSEETKAKLRAITAKMISEGRFPQTDTLPMREFEKILKELNILNLFKKELYYEYYSIDFGNLEYRIAFEVDGDFWHSHPDKFPDGPIYESQKRTKKAEKSKTTFLLNRGWKLYRFWESDILNEREKIKNKVKEIMEELWNS